MSIIKHITLQRIVAHDFRYDPRIMNGVCIVQPVVTVLIRQYGDIFQKQVAHVAASLERNIPSQNRASCAALLPYQ